MFFVCLKEYEYGREYLFMPELYDFYWDTSDGHPRQRKDVEAPFQWLAKPASILSPCKSVTLRCRLTGGAWRTRPASTCRRSSSIFCFIGDYDLIRVLAYDGQYCDFDLHRGLRIARHERQPLPGQDLRPGLFYLRRGGR